MQDFNWIIFLIFGLLIGSFLNVVVFRIDDLKSIATGRSHCQNCKKDIAWYDLIPVISFMLLKGKCRYCKSNISWQYPVVEIATALVFVILFLVFGLSLATFFYIFIFCLLMVIAVYDIKTQFVPDSLVWIVLIISLLGGYIGGFGLSSMVLGALVGGGLLAFLVVVSKEKWMGAGDIKIGIILGLLNGFGRSIVALFLSFLLGSIVGLIYIYVTKKTMKSSLPFAPFLIVSTLIALVVGNFLIDWYLGKIYL